ncbi:MAG: ABC transporter permease [Cyclobacteriaceae bacterium]|nr:ABC transporter permease [Cyclobacteriaceae bacterium]
MNNSFLIRSLGSEFSKAKGTFIPWLTIGAPIIYSVLIYLTLYHVGDRIIKHDSDAWQAVANQSFEGLYTLLLPLAICLLTALIYQTDHQANMWKHLYALPIPRWGIFFAKSLFVYLLIGLSLILYAMFIVVVGFILSKKYPAWELTNYWEALWGILLPTAIKGWIASLGIWSIQNWLSYRFRNFAIPLSLGLGAALVGAISIQSWKYAFYFPYSFPMLSLVESKADFNHSILLTSLCMGGVIFILSVLDAHWLYRGKGKG